MIIPTSQHVTWAYGLMGLMLLRCLVALHTFVVFVCP